MGARMRCVSDQQKLACGEPGLTATLARTNEGLESNHNGFHGGSSEGFSRKYLRSLWWLSLRPLRFLIVIDCRDNNHFDLDISGKFRVFNSQSQDEISQAAEGSALTRQPPTAMKTFESTAPWLHRNMNRNSIMYTTLAGEKDKMSEIKCGFLKRRSTNKGERFKTFPIH